MPCFLAGQNTAQAVATALSKPIIKTSHQQGHIAAALFGANYFDKLDEKYLVFHISGGTTELLLTQGYRVIERVGASRDLYAGQAVDRLGVLLGLEFPAGAELSVLAEKCCKEVKPKISVYGTDCNFSGLQNICAKLLEDHPKEYVAKYCLSTIADTLTAMLSNARKKYGLLPAIFAGGVMSSGIIKGRVEGSVSNVSFVDPLFAGDNAIGVALIAAKEVDFG